jgi:SAM-dependent methyltransferase
MLASTRAHYDAFPDPSPALVPIGPGQLERLDDALHFAWAWHRYKFVFRRAEGLRILDAGCGTGVTTLALATLNPGAMVVGIDVSPKSLDVARERAAASGIKGVEFREHDLTRPLPSDWGGFDFVVARGVLGGFDDDAAILAALARALDDRGLLMATFPGEEGREPARRLRRAVDALVPAGAAPAQRAEAGLELLRALRPDHPIRKFDAARHGADPPSIERVAATYLGDGGREWTLEGARAAVERAGLSALYVATRAPWRPDRVFGPDVPAGLRDRVAALAEPELAALKDALDGSLHPDGYTVYACPAGFEPHLPAWPEDNNPAALERLVPHATGLSSPAGLKNDAAAARGRVLYRTASGALGELDARSDRALRIVDGRRSIAEIEAQLAATSGPDAPDARRIRWTDLANFGFVLLESPDPRQHVDCIHLGPVKDRLDCACPRRWVRGCEVHGLCTISTVEPGDPKAAALRGALARLGAGAAMACDRCPDYSPEG